MPPIFAKLFIVLAALVIGAPAFAQTQSSGSSEQMSAEQMSAVSGEFAGGIGAGIPTRTENGNCAGAACGGGVQGNALGTSTRDVSASGNSYTVNVTAINIQTSIVGPGVINTSGGLNAAGGGGVGAGAGN